MNNGSPLHNFCKDVILIGLIQRECATCAQGGIHWASVLLQGLLPPNAQAQGCGFLRAAPNPRHFPQSGTIATQTPLTLTHADIR